MDGEESRRSVGGKGKGTGMRMVKLGGLPDRWSTTFYASCCFVRAGLRGDHIKTTSWIKTAMSRNTDQKCTLRTRCTHERHCIIPVISINKCPSISQPYRLLSLTTIFPTRLTDLSVLGPSLIIYSPMPPRRHPLSSLSPATCHPIIICPCSMLPTTSEGKIN